MKESSLEHEVVTGNGASTPRACSSWGIVAVSGAIIRMQREQGNPEGKKYQQNRKGKQRQIYSQEISPCTFPQGAATVKCSLSILQGAGPVLSLAWSRASRSGVDASWSPNRKKPTLLLEKPSSLKKSAHLISEFTHKCM